MLKTVYAWDRTWLWAANGCAHLSEVLVSFDIESGSTRPLLYFSEGSIREVQSRGKIQQ